MVSKRLNIYVFISAAAIVSGALVGCGGSSAALSGPGPQVKTSGGTTNTVGTNPTTTTGTPVTTQNAPQQVQVTTSSGTVTGVLPANEVIPPSGNLTVIPAGQPIITGLGYAPKTHGEKLPPQASSGTQGEIDVNGVPVTGTDPNTGQPVAVTVNSQGELSMPLLLAPGSGTADVTYSIKAWGPFNITVGAQTLTITSYMLFNASVAYDGGISLPYTSGSSTTNGLTMQLPANGGLVEGSNFVTVQYPAEFAVGTATLQIDGVTPTSPIIKTSTVTSGATVTFKQFNGNSTVPGGGITDVIFTYNP
jgi:hypothetical protein